MLIDTLISIGHALFSTESCRYRWFSGMRLSLAAFQTSRDCPLESGCAKRARRNNSFLEGKTLKRQADIRSTSWTPELALLDLFLWFRNGALKLVSPVPLDLHLFWIKTWQYFISHSHAIWKENLESGLYSARIELPPYNPFYALCHPIMLWTLKGRNGVLWYK